MSKTFYRTETQRQPVAINAAGTFHVKVERLKHIDSLVYYTSKTGRTLAVRFWSAMVPGQKNQPTTSPVVYLPIDKLIDGMTDDQLVNLASYKLLAWSRRTLQRYAFEELVVACRPYRATHLDVLRTVNRTIHGKYGDKWWLNDEAMRVATSTLRQFGVAV